MQRVAEVQGFLHSFRRRNETSCTLLQRGGLGRCTATTHSAAGVVGNVRGFILGILGCFLVRWLKGLALRMEKLWCRLRPPARFILETFDPGLLPPISVALESSYAHRYRAWHCQDELPSRLTLVSETWE